MDGRYTLQAREQVDSAIFNVRELADDGVSTYLRSHAATGCRIGYDPRLHTPKSLQIIEAAAGRAGALLVPVMTNPLDLVWGPSRPPQAAAPVVPHPLRYSGEDSGAKRARIGAILAAKKVDAAVLTEPASIAWLFNIRGGDISRTPLPLGCATLSQDGTAQLFISRQKVSPILAAWLGDQVSLRTPDAMAGALRELRGRKVLIDPRQSSIWFFDELASAGAEVVQGQDPCALPRACKNFVEIEGSRRAHIRDDVALTRFLH